MKTKKKTKFRFSKVFFSYFHGQNKFKIRVSVDYSVRTKNWLIDFVIGNPSLNTNPNDCGWVETMQRYQRKPRWKTRAANDNFLNSRKFVHVYLGNSGGQRVERLLSPKILLRRSFLDYSESHDPTLMYFLQISCCGCIGRYLVFSIPTRITPLKIHNL